MLNTLNTRQNVVLPEELEDKYQIKGFIGNGTYGYIYRAINWQTDQPVVIKVSSEEDIKRDCSSLKNETQFLRWLRHENIIRLIDFSVFSDQDKEKRPLQQSALVLEECVCDLKKVMFSSLMTAQTIKTVITQLFHGLVYLQSCFVIHCDVKPSNILLSSNGVLKLCDFGLTRPGGFHNKKPGFNRRFSPPETLLGATTLNCNVDAWSAGCILTELFKKSFLFLLKDDIIDENLKEIFKICGSYTEETWGTLFPFCDERKKKICTTYRPRILASMLEEFIEDRLARNLICRLLVIHPSYRWTSKEALNSFYIRSYPFPLPDLKSLVKRFQGLSDSEDHDRNSDDHDSDSDDDNSDSITFLDDSDDTLSDDETR